MRFSIPREEPVYQIDIERCNGADLNNSPSKVRMNRSPACPNMIRETPGHNVKRMGYETIFSLTGKINGIHTLRLSDSEDHIVHSGTKYYKANIGLTPTATDLGVTGNNKFSMAFQMNSKLYVLDGLSYLKYDGTTMASVEGFIPTILISRDPTGGGVVYEPINLLSDFRWEHFLGNGTDKTYQLSATGINANTVEVKSLQADGTYETLTEGTDFTVNRTLGTVIFNSVKPTPATGVDNIQIKYSKTVTGYRDRINKCTICTLYGLNGAMDRVVVSGNPEFKNTQWHSASNDPTYIGDTFYTLSGQDTASIVGYSISGDLLAVHRDYSENGSNVHLMKGALVSNSFTLISEGAYAAEGALSKYAINAFDNEPVYLTVDKNVSAITPQDYSGEKFSQLRSYYLTKLIETTATNESYACIWNKFYVITGGEYLMLLDSVQPIYERNELYANRQYEGYYFTGINARVVKTINDELWFGTADGKVKKFTEGLFSDDGVVTEETVEVDGEQITTKLSYRCYWETPELYGKDVELKKTFKHLALLLTSFPYTGCRVWIKVDGIWEVLFDYDAVANFLDFSDLRFDELTFRTDDTPTLAGGKFTYKNALHTQLRFENSKPQPFGIYFAIIKYVLGGEYIK